MKKTRLKNILAGKKQYNVLHLVKNKINGCVYYRNINPLIYLKTANVADCKATSEITTSHAYNEKTGETAEVLDASLVDWADVVVFSRYYDASLSNLVEGYARCARDLGKVIVYECDDDLFNVPEHNGVHSEVQESLSTVKTLMEMADAYTVTTSRLGDFLNTYYNKPTYVLPNSIEPDLYQKAKFKKNRDKIRIGWAGGNTHAFDLVQVIPALTMLQAKYNNVEVVGLGPKALKELFFSVNVEWHEFTQEVTDYPEKLVDLDLDIGIIPLEDYEFNYNKSVIKWIEYSAAKMATVYANIPPYSDEIEDGKTGLAVKEFSDKVDWFNELSKLIDDEALRVELAENAYSYVMDEYNMLNNWELWNKAYKNLLKEKHS